MILLSALCIVISLELAILIPQGRRYDETFLENKGHNGFSEQSISEHIKPYVLPSKFNEPKNQENLRPLLLKSEGYSLNNFEGNKKSLSDSKYIQNPSTLANNGKIEEISLNSRYKTQIRSFDTLAEQANQHLMSNEYQRTPVVTKLGTNTFYSDQNQFNTYPEAFGKFNQQQTIISENGKGNENIERNFHNAKDELPSIQYVASLPQDNRIQSFRANKERIREVSVSNVGDLLSEFSNDKRNIFQNELNRQAVPKVKTNADISNINQRQNSRVENIVNSLEHKYEEDTIKLNIPMAEPQYIDSILNEYKSKQNNNKNSLHIARNGMENKDNIQPNIQNLPGTSQNPSAEILYKTGQANPYELSNEHIFDLRQGYPRGGNILSNSKILKDLYISSKPSKRYMIVYPDGRVEQVDQLEKIQKMYPNYVMLHAKELLDQSKPNLDITDRIQESVINSKSLVDAGNILKQSFNPIPGSEKNQLPKLVSQNDKKQPTPITTDETAVSSVYEEVQSSYINPEFPETMSTNVNKVQNPVQEVENPSDTPTNPQEKNIFNQKEDKALDYKIISTTEIPFRSREEIFKKGQISPTNENGEEVKILEPPYPELSDSNLEGNITTNTKSDISSSLSPLVIPQNVEEIKNNKNITNVAEIPDTNKNISVTDHKISKYDDENPDIAALTKESNIFSTDNTITLLSSNNSGTDESSTNKTQFEKDFMNMTNSSPPSSNEEKALDVDNGFGSSQIGTEGLNSNHQDSKNDINVPKDQTIDENNLVFDYTAPNHINSENTPYEAYSSFGKPDSNKTTVNEKETISDTKGGVSNENPGTSIEEDDNAKPVPEKGKLTDNEENSVPIFVSNDSYYQNPKEKGVVDERDTNDDDDNKKESTTSKSNDNAETDFSTSPGKDENTDFEPSWFNFNEIFLSKLMSNDDLHNTFYFLFPRPNPIVKETKKTIYSNGTVVIETSETIDVEGDEKSSSKIVHRCEKCATCDS